MILLWELLAAVCLVMFWKQPFLLSPTAIFFAYFALVFPISYLVSYFLDLPSPIFPAPRNIPHAKLEFAFLQIVLGLASFCCGRFLLPAATLVWREVNLVKGRFGPLLALSILLAVAGFFSVIHQIGGFSAIIDDSGGVRSGELRGLGAGTFAVTTLLPTLVQFGLMYALREKLRLTWLIFLICVLSCALGGLFGFRGLVLVLLIQMASVIHIMTGKTRRKQIVLVIGLLGVLAVVMGYARIVLTEQGQAFRALASGDRADVAAVLLDNSITRTRGLEAVIAMDDYMERAPYHYFVDNIAETAKAIVPSFVLSKGLSLSEKIGTAVYGSYMMSVGNIHDVYGGASYTLVAEGYWNLGIPGIALLCCLLGYAVRIIETSAAKGTACYRKAICYKTVAGAMVLFIEVPQLGINGIVITLALNFGILYCLSAKVRWA